MITKPSLAVATEAYQALLELARAHPADVELAGYRDQAYSLMHGLWREHHDAAVARSRLSEFL